MEPINELALRGDVNSVRRLHRAGHALTEATAYYAAQGGCLELMQFLHDNTCPWGETTATNASRHGHLHILQYLIDSGCPCNTDVYEVAKIYNHKHILKYLDHEQSCRCSLL